VRFQLVELVGRDYEANNATEAIRSYIQTAGTDKNSSGLYVAVPSRSWRPTKVSTTTQTILKLEEATG
jgi:hypothetical protein